MLEKPPLIDIIQQLAKILMNFKEDYLQVLLSFIATFPSADLQSICKWTENCVHSLENINLNPPVNQVIIQPSKTALPSSSSTSSIISATTRTTSAKKRQKSQPLKFCLDPEPLIKGPSIPIVIQSLAEKWVKRLLSIAKELKRSPPLQLDV